MTTIAVTGASGNLGRLTLEALLARGIDPQTLIALTRTPSKAADLATAGVDVREADFDRPETLAPALSGVDRLLIVSTDGGDRAAQQRNAIEAATSAGVKLIAYTSLLRATEGERLLAEDHIQTEEYVRASGIDYVLLRNGWYSENYLMDLAGVLERGKLTGGAPDGAVSVAARKDYAEAAAIVLASSGHENTVYELGGDSSITGTEIAAKIAEVTGRDVVYESLTADELEQMMVAMGMPEEMARTFADVERWTAEGYLVADSGDLSRLIGRSTTPFEHTVREAAARL